VTGLSDWLGGWLAGGWLLQLKAQLLQLCCFVVNHLAAACCG
jgi:hypothetical protein